MRLRELIRDRGSGITFGLYTGDSDTVAQTVGEPVECNEIIGRKKMQQNPPDVILTNYKQLEFMLVRKDDRPFFTPSLRDLVLDELHSYRGALATEIACLIQRLKARCRLEPGRLRCIATTEAAASLRIGLSPVYPKAGESAAKRSAESWRRLRNPRIDPRPRDELTG